MIIERTINIASTSEQFNFCLIRWVKSVNSSETLSAKKSNSGFIFDNFSPLRIYKKKGEPRAINSPENILFG